jgi:tetratricopeptide (TPR) repeat protein
MRKLLDAVLQRLKAFVAQRDNLALVLNCHEGEGPSLLTILESLEEQSASEMFWQFPEAFVTPQEYASSIVQSFAARHELVRLQQAEAGMAVWPALPPELRNEAAPPSQRIRELMLFARSLLPTLDGALLVWVMLPLQIADQNAYATLMQQVLRHEFPFPWCHHIRCIVRGEPTDPALAESLKQIRHIDWYAPDLSPAALHAALESEAADEALPLEDRLQSVFVTANTDYAHKRYDLALDKYATLLPYYANTGNLTMAALVLNGMGEVHRAAGNAQQANACFEAAMVPASDGNQPPVAALLNVSINLATMRMDQKRYDEAENYFEGIQKLATMHRAHELKVWALEQKGQALYLQSKAPLAVATWTAAAKLAEMLEQPELAKGPLEKLRDHYAKVRDASQQRAVETQLAALK